MQIVLDINKLASYNLTIPQVINNRNKAIITFRQGIGRGLRNNHDKVFIAVCDPRIYYKKNASFLYFIESMSVPHKMQKKI